MAYALTSSNRASASRADDRTVAFYDSDPDAYSRSTLDNDLSELYSPFLKLIPDGGLVLDAGSGSGRDIRAFLSLGYRVDAFDASMGMAALASRLTGVKVRVARFEDWPSAVSTYDGIWCFASLLHVAAEDLPDVLSRLTNALRPGAPLFASFKEGDGETIDDLGRRYTNLTIEAARELFGSVPGLVAVSVWRDDGPSGLGGRTRWVYVLATKGG